MAQAPATARLLSNPTLCSLVLSLVCTLLAWPALAEERLAISLAPTANVSSKLFYLGDIASYANGEAALWEAVAAEPLGYRPLPGCTANLTAANILGTLKERGYPWQQINVTGDAVAITAAAPQAVGSETVRAALELSLAEQISSAVEIIELETLPALNLQGGTISLAVRYPARPGQWLPVAMDILIDGQLRDTLPLGQYVSFKLPVVVASTQIPAHTALTAAELVLAEVELRPGSEVVATLATVVGLESRTTVTPGAPVKLSQLKQPFAVRRGEQVTLVFGSGAVELRAVGTALGNAYAGQQLQVERLGDGQRFTGELQEDNMVVVQ